MTEKIKIWAKKRRYTVLVADRYSLNEFRMKIKNSEFPGTLMTRDLFNTNNEFREMLENLKDIDTFSSVILVAIPRPAHRLRFQTFKNSIETIIPPTYVNYRKLNTDILLDIMKFMEVNKKVFRIFDSYLKTLAVHTGLSQFGRNNITYNDKYGSYFQLVGIGLLEEIEGFSPSASQPKNQLDQCYRCSACLNHCPTNAIRNDRFLINAHKCLSNLNIKPGTINKLSKIEPGYFCIVGCLDCQEICPANKGKLRWEDIPVEFSFKETETILSGNDAHGYELWCNKMNAFELSTSYGIVARNLRYIINQQINQA